MVKKKQRLNKYKFLTCKIMFSYVELKHAVTNSVISSRRMKFDLPIKFKLELVRSKYIFNFIFHKI